MIETSNDHTSFAEFIIQDNAAESIKERIQLVRILSRSSTLPKVEDIYIRSFPSNPDSFFIEPGRSIRIGVNLLNSPVAALLCIRYSLEWQIWFKNQNKEMFDPRICDLAACNVAAKFYNLTPQKDKAAIKQVPRDIADIIFRFQSVDDFSNVLSDADFKTLGLFHDQNYPQSKINNDYIEILHHLANPLEHMLMSGGDLRLNVDPNRLLNVYGCRPFPRPEAFSFASSTATSISNVAFNQTEYQRESLIRESLKKGIFETAALFSKNIRTELKKALTLPTSTSLILAPSGTDITLQVAGICQSIFKKDIVHILVASDETGSGVPLALQGKHFSDRTSQGYDVEKGSSVKGFRDVELVNIKLRNQKGELKRTSDVDHEVYDSITQAFDNNKQPVLHVMDQSKMGYSAPSEKCLQKLQDEFGKSLLVLIDNSQLRMDQKDIRDYISRGYLMTVTGSKFFTGPPFNGALIIPEKIKEDWINVDDSLPRGLNEYYYKNEWPENWDLSKKLKEGINFGVKMRWYSSIIEIERYFQTPLSLRYLGLEMFCDHVAESIEQASFLEHLPDYNDTTNSASEPQKIKDRRSIFPFFVKLGNSVLNQKEINKLYRLLNRDLSGKIDEESDESKRWAGQACHIGQPVNVTYKDGTPSGVVRISLGSRVISKSWKDRDASIFFKKIEAQMIQVDIIIRKIELILNHPDWLKD